jgi:hypothetical protein
MNQVSSNRVRPILTTQDKVQLHLTEQFEQKCRHLCNLFPNREWSGMLFYKVRDLNKDMSLFEIDVTDFYPMSVDTAGHTDFQYEANYVPYMIANNLLEHDKGLIHSHNTMQVWFSSEDMSELQDNTPNHTFYLSLIVNNRFDVMAKMCTIVKMPNSKRVGEYVDISGNPKKLEIDEPNPEYLFTVDCIINKPVNTISFNKDWLDQLGVVIENDKKVKVVIPPTGQQGTLFNRELPNYRPNIPKPGFDDWNSSDYKPVPKQQSGVVTIKSLKDFVVTSILGGEITDSLYMAAKTYEFSEEIEEIIYEYDDLFGKTDQQEELTMLKGVVNILTQVQALPEVAELIQHLNEGIAFKETML